MRSITFCMILLFTSNIFSQNGWFTQTSQTTKYLNSVYFIDAYEGFAVGRYGTILRTSNGGTTWSKSQGNFQESYNDITFLKDESNIGYIFGTYTAIGTVLKSDDEGKTWDLVCAIVDELFWSGYAHEDNNTVFVVGGPGIIHRSTDGGESWPLQTIPGNIFRSITFYNSEDLEVGIIVGDNGKIYRTENKGESWTQIESPTSNHLRCVHFPSENIGYACGYNGTIIKTTNGGESWSTVSSGTTTDLRSIFFSTNNTGYVVGNSGLIRKTFNGGNDWGAQYSPTTQYLNSVFFVDSNVGYIVGQNGTVLRTSDGGGRVYFDKQDEELKNDKTKSSDLTLNGNFPNPFNPSTNIKYTLTQNNFVSLKVYNSVGQEVATLMNKEQKPGEYNVTFDGSELASGIYYYILKSGTYMKTNKILLLK